MIEVNHLTKSYGDRRGITELNFTVRKGEVVGFLGPNGAGKTTTMKIITGAMAPTSGSVKVAGHDVFEEPLEVKKRVGYLPETPPLYVEMSVQDYLVFVAKLRKVPSDQIQKNVDRALEKAHLTDVGRRLIKNLSKGYRQRVGLAQALVSNPEILILDEPTVGLDPKQVAEMRSLFRELRGQHTIILSTHILSEVQAICERIIIINEGRIAATDTIKALKERSNHAHQLRMKVSRPNENLKTLLEGLPGINSVRMLDQSIDVDLEWDDSLIESVAETVVTSGAGLLELKSEELNLEDIFIQLTQTESREVR